MGETQIYSRRIHGITEKRRIMDEVDRIQRDLEMQKLKLQQLKRKSLRDRWLMDGLVPSPGAEIENPLNETEEKIKTLEHEMESLQLQLLYLENPDMKITDLKKQQGSDPPKQLVNGDPSQEISDQKDPTPGKRENQKESKVIQEEELPHDEEKEKQGGDVDPSQNDPTPTKVIVVAGHPIPAPRGKKVERIQDQTSSDHKLDTVSQIHEDKHNRNIEDKEIQNLHHSLEPQEDRSENLGPNEEHKEESHDHHYGHTDQDLSAQKSEDLDERLELDEDNMEHLAKGLEHRDLGLNVEVVKVVVLPISVSDEDIRNDLDNRNDMVKITLLEEREDHESGTQPSPVMEKHYEHQGEPVEWDNDVEGKAVLVSVIQDQNEEIIVQVGNQDQMEDCALPRRQEEAADPMPVLIGYDKDQDSESSSFPAHQGLVLLPSDREQSPKLPCKDPDFSGSLPCEALVSQVQISQVVVISTPGRTSSEEPAQLSSDSLENISTDHRHEPASTEASTPPESQPLLHKPVETDTPSSPHGTNTAETRDKNPPEKKKSCHCCVLM